jgi:antitoxin component YwqK of YwqJK toxin-antitoxin module
MGKFLKIKTLIPLLIFFLFSVSQSYSQNIISFSKLKERDNKLYLGEQVFSGLVVKTFITNQPKSITEIKDGIINGKVVEFIEDLSFVSKSFKDTAEINRINYQISSKKQEFEQAIQDTVKTSKEQYDFLNYEIGGSEKLLKLKEKDTEGKLNKNKKEIYDKYEQYVQTNKQCIRKFNDIQLQINNLNQQIKSENDKPSYIPQKALEYSLLNGIKEGAAIVYDLYGNKFGEGSYLNGKQNGKWVYYFSNEKKFGEGSFLNGDESEKCELGVPKNGRDGVWIFYHENGKIEGEAHYKNGLLNGARKSYFDNGQLNEEENYQNGKLNGIRKVYLENGSLKEDGNYENGKESGVFTFYYENGSKESESTYLYGKKNGKEVLFYNNGNIKEEYFIQDTTISGIFNSYFESGKKEREISLKNGKTDGIIKKYFENGKTESELNYKNGKQHGLFKFYFESGALKSKGSIDTLSIHKNKFIGDLFTYKADGNVENHFYVNKDGTLEDKMENNSKSTESKSKYSISEMNKPYKCKCCKSTINGLTDGVDKDGNEYTQWIFEFNAGAYYSVESSFKALGFKDVYDYMRRNEYINCSLKCSRACY